MTRVDEVLQFLEENLDVDHVENAKNRLKRVINYEKPDRLSVKTNFPFTGFKGYCYSEAYEDMEKMMVNELLGICSGAVAKDDTMPMLRANYGVGTLPSLFGLNCKIVNNSMPWVDHVGNEVEIRKLIERGVPDIKAGLGARIFETHEYYSEKLVKYPKCKKMIHVYHPDLQGPFDVSHLIWGPEIYYAVYDEPQLVHDLMKLVTETYIKFMTEIKKTINDEEKDESGTYNYHWGSLYRGRIVLRDDTPVNLSKEMYEEFVKPYDEQILKAFGEGSIHYCGRADQWVFSMMECEGLGGMNFGQPPNMVFGFEWLEKIYDEAEKRKIACIIYGMPKEDMTKLPGTKFETGVSYSTGVSNKDEAIALINSVK